MPFDKHILNNEVDVISKLGVGGDIDFGLLTTAGVDRLFKAIGAAPNIYINFLPKGVATLRVPTGYETLLSDTKDIVNKGYTDIKILGKDVMPPLQTPGVPENGFAIVWNNTEGKFTLATTASNKTFASGIEDVSTVVKLGTTPLDRHTDINGAATYNLNLGTLASKLLNLEASVVTKIELTGGTNKLILNGANPVTLQGGVALSTIVINAGGGILIADNQGGTSQRGLRGGHDYSANVQLNDYIQKVYTDNRIGGKSVNTLIKSPTSAQHGFGIVWNNALGQYTLADTTGASVSTIPKKQRFIATEGQTAFAVDNGTILYINFVDINGDVQTEGEDYLRSGQIVNVTPGLPAGYEITIHYWEDLSVGGAGGGGGVNNAHFLFDTVILATDPNDGKVRLNAISFDTATEIYIDNSTTDGVDISTGLEDLATGDEVRLQLASNDDNNAVYKLLAMPVNNGGWWTLSVVNMVANGVLFADLAEIVLVFLYGGSGGGEGVNIDGGVADSIYDTLPVMDGGAP